MGFALDVHNLSMANIFTGHCKKHCCRKFAVEHEKKCVGYGTSYTSITTRTFQTCKRTIKNLQFSSTCKTRKTANQPATLIAFQFWTKQSRYNQLETKEIDVHETVCLYISCNLCNFYN